MAVVPEVPLNNQKPDKIIWTDPFIEGVIVLSLAVLFFILKTYGLNPAVSDENIYFYTTLVTGMKQPIPHHNEIDEKLVNT